MITPFQLEKLIHPFVPSTAPWSHIFPHFGECLVDLAWRRRLGSWSSFHNFGFLFSFQLKQSRVLVNLIKVGALCIGGHWCNEVVGDLVESRRWKKSGWGLG